MAGLPRWLKFERRNCGPSYVLAEGLIHAGSDAPRPHGDPVSSPVGGPNEPGRSPARYSGRTRRLRLAKPAQAQPPIESNDHPFFQVSQQPVKLGTVVLLSSRPASAWLVFGGGCSARPGRIVDDLALARRDYRNGLDARRRAGPHDTRDRKPFGGGAPILPTSGHLPPSSRSVGRLPGTPAAFAPLPGPRPPRLAGTFLGQFEETKRCRGDEVGQFGETLGTF